MGPGIDDSPLGELSRRLQTILEDVHDAADDPLLAAFEPPPDPAEEDNRAAIRDRIERLPQIVGPEVEVATSSRIPGGSTAHRAILAATRRENQAILEADSPPRRGS